MSGAIEIQLNGQIPDIVSHAETTVETGVQLPVYPILSGEENGAILFNLEWQTRYAEDLRHYLLTSFGNPPELNETGNLPRQVWHDLINAARDHNKFAEFRRQPENFWQQVRQLSEPRILRDLNGNERRIASRFDDLLATMRAKNLSPREFAETLSASEKNVFKARLQLEQTFGRQLLGGGDAMPNEAGRSFLSKSQTVAPSDPAADKSADAPRFLPSGGAPPAEAAFGTKNQAGAAVFVFVRDNLNAAPPLKHNFPGDPILRDAALNSPNNPVGTTLVPESSAARTLKNFAAESPPNNHAARHDEGAFLGGALISGAFAAIENYQNSRDDRLGDARTGLNVFETGGNNLAAGATGALFGAAVGTIIPGAETVISGVLGFVSSVVIGVEAERGVRWLGADAATFGAIDNAPVRVQ